MSVSGSCLKCVWVVSESCLGRVQTVSGSCPEACHEACLRHVWVVLRRAAIYYILLVVRLLVCIMLGYVIAFATLHYIRLNVTCYVSYYTVTGSSKRG